VFNEETQTIRAADERPSTQIEERFSYLRESVFIQPKNVLRSV
jgi:hypothetical protein